MSKIQSAQRGFRWRTIERVVAVLLLLCAGVDLAVPQLCSGENFPLFRVRSEVTVFDGVEHERPSPLPTEDCFCCCSHIVRPEAMMPVTTLALVSASVARTFRLPLPPVQAQFHPPRSA